MSWRFRNLFLLLAASADGLMFKSGDTWDTWAFVENGTYYAYYLITEESPGEGFGVATSPNGASNWTDHGYVWHVCGMGRPGSRTSIGRARRPYGGPPTLTRPAVISSTTARI
jgi:hypothetical protein